MEELKLIKASEKDCAIYWLWANDPSVRSKSFSTEKIHWPDHMKWFSSKLNSEDVSMWVLVYRGARFGQIRGEIVADDTAEVHFSVDRVARGRGFGSKMLSMSSDVIARDLGVSKIIGVVIEGNTASERVFEKAGFTLVDRREIRGKMCNVYGLNVGN